MKRPSRGVHLRTLIDAALCHQQSEATAFTEGDLLQGAEEIAAFLLGGKEFRRKVYKLAGTGKIPYFRRGRMICARKSELLAWLVKKPD